MMAKFWAEPIDVKRHLDHFHSGAAVPRGNPRHEGSLSYFVQVAGFTFEFASTDQIREGIAFFEKRIHGSSRSPVFEPEKGHWEAWHERLPAHILKGSKRDRVLMALRDALIFFSKAPG